MRTVLARSTFSASRIAVFLAVSAVLCATELAPVRSPIFSDYPFDQWAAAAGRATIKWNVRLLPPRLSVHQRLIERVQAVIPGSELDKRKGRGELVLLTRFEDGYGRQWRAGSRLNLAKVEPGAKGDDLTFTVGAFVKPGDYWVSLALLDTHTMEHSFTRRPLHVAPLKADPLPDAWSGLPPVEILPPVDGPDAWFLPTVKGLLHLATETNANASEGGIANKWTGDAAHVDLMINTTPTAWSPNPAGALRRNMSVVIPALKVLSGLTGEVRPPSASVIDLTHHRISFQTPNAASLDWTALGKLLSGINPGIIDVKSLSAQSSMRDYFAQEVARRARNSGPRRWLIVMSGPMTFANQDGGRPPELLPDSNRHIVYLRFSPGFANGMHGGPMGIPGVEIAPVQRVHGPNPEFGGAPPPAPDSHRGRGVPAGPFPDDLERVLKPMGAQVFTITTPETFRKTVASLLRQISAAD